MEKIYIYIIYEKNRFLSYSRLQRGIETRKTAFLCKGLAHRKTSNFLSLTSVLLPMMYLRHSLLLIVIVASSLAVSSLASNVKIGSRLGYFLENGDVDSVLPKQTTLRRSDGTYEETTAIWVLFNSKCGTSLENEGLTAKAIARRAKHGFVLIFIPFKCLLFGLYLTLYVFSINFYAQIWNIRARQASMHVTQNCC
jgi:hypothetical protein